MLKSKRKAPNVVFIDENDEQIQPPKKRAKGRPKVSKKKPKYAPAWSLRERAEAAAYVELESETCNICLFWFDNAIKKDKALPDAQNVTIWSKNPVLWKVGAFLNYVLWIFE